MLRPRVIPCLLVKGGGLVKTVQFGEGKYVGDPINAVRIFNEKEVDELMVVDIDASVQEREPDYRLIRSLAAECRMPLCYGGGVRNVAQIKKIIGLGVEKVALSSAAIEQPEIISEAAGKVGSQSVVVVLDVRRAGLLRRYELYIHNGKRKTGLNPVIFAKKAQECGVGEIVLNSIDCDGLMQGYDLQLAQEVRKAVSVPLTVLGGAGSLSDIKVLIERLGIVGAAAGSLFVFKGKYRAVLINYPNRDEKDNLVCAGNVSGS